MGVGFMESWKGKEGKREWVENEMRRKIYKSRVDHIGAKQ